MLLSLAITSKKCNSDHFGFAVFERKIPPFYEENRFCLFFRIVELNSTFCFRLIKISNRGEDLSS